jgi:hypothetical protein
MDAAPGSARELTRQAISATAHCLTGCAIGEVLGMVIATALGWSDAPSIALAVALAFFFGYLLSLRPYSAQASGWALPSASSSPLTPSPSPSWRSLTTR